MKFCIVGSIAENKCLFVGIEDVRHVIIEIRKGTIEKMQKMMRITDNKCLERI